MSYYKQEILYNSYIVRKKIKPLLKLYVSKLYFKSYTA